MARDTEPVDLRGSAPRDVIDVIDAISTARRKNRMELVNEILRDWVDDRLKEVVAIKRVVGEPLQ